MKKIIILVLASVLLAACTFGKNADSYDEGLIATADNIDEADILDGIDVNSFFQMSLGEVIDLLEKNHPGISYTVSAYDICYEKSCRIRFREGAILNEDGETKIEIDLTDLEARILAVDIFQVKDIYKGISTGKTLDEINSSPDLKNKFTAGTEEMTNTHEAIGFYDYNGIFIGMGLIFDDIMICTEIHLNVAEDLRGDLIVRDRMI